MGQSISSNQVPDDDATRAALEGLLTRFVNSWVEQSGTLPTQSHDPRWISPCQVGEPNADGVIQWRPVPRLDAASFDGVEHALETPIHPSIKAFFGAFWCDCFTAKTEDGGLTLIQAWNAEDFDRLCENILGHALSLRRARLPLTVFIACTDEEELNLSIDNASGRVVLERPGEPPLRNIDDSLPGFLRRLVPVVDR